MENEKQKDISKRKKLEIVYLIILIILLIFVFLVSFKTGEQMYYLVNTNLDDVEGHSKTNVSNWNFEAWIEY